MAKWDREDAAFSLGIHYRYTNIHNRTYDYRLVLYGEACYLDERAVKAGWKPELFFTLLEEDIGENLKPLRKQFPRLCAYEEELVRYHCAAYYQAAICQLCRDMWSEIVASEVFEGLPKTKEFVVFFGAYKGERKSLLSQFVVKEQKGNPIPRMVNWYGKLDIRKLNRKEYRKHTYPELEGMIYWTYVNKPKSEPEAITVKEKENESIWEKVKDNAEAVGTGLAFIAGILWWIYANVNGVPVPAPTFAEATCNNNTMV